MSIGLAIFLVGVLFALIISPGFRKVALMLTVAAIVGAAGFWVYMTQPDWWTGKHEQVQQADTAQQTHYEACTGTDECVQTAAICREAATAEKCADLLGAKGHNEFDAFDLHWDATGLHQPLERTVSLCTADQVKTIETATKLPAGYHLDAGYLYTPQQVPELGASCVAP